MTAIALGGNLGDVAAWSNKYGALVQLATGLALLVVTFLYLLTTASQSRASRAQVRSTERAAEAQAMVSIVAFLQEPHVRNARTLVRSMAPNPDWRTKWTDDQLSAIATTCASFDAAGSLVLSGLIHRQPFVSIWASALVDCWYTCEIYVRDLRQTSGHAFYWSAFEELAAEARDLIDNGDWGLRSPLA